MPEGFVKVLGTMAGVLFLSGCISHLATPFTFGPLLIANGAILLHEGGVSQNVLTMWEVLTWITYIQLLIMVIQPGAIILLSRVREWKRVRWGGRPPYRLWRSVKTFVTRLLLLTGALVLVTYLHFPSLRNAPLYPGVWTQWLIGLAALPVGLYFWWGVSYR